MKLQPSQRERALSERLKVTLQPGRWKKPLSLWLLVVVVVGIGVRIAYVDRPLDHRMLTPWRPADYIQVARNFYRDGMNIFYPSIDWRGDTPGYAEMEFPVLPWVGALLYRVFGYHEALLRVLSAILGSASLLLFVHLCRCILPPVGTVFAAGAFALNPLLIHLSTALQPEPLMLFLSLTAIVLLWHWQARPRYLTLLGTAIAIAAAILAKATAAYLGFVFAYAVLRHCRWKTCTDIKMYIAGLVAIVPPLAWYMWAARFWTLYGNSLGVSNESHFIGWDVLVPPAFLVGNLKWETLGVFTPLGWLLALAGLRAPRAWRELAMVWYGAVWIFYLIAARTSGDDWAFFYHSASVAPACLLMGAGYAALARGGIIPSSWRWLRSREPWLGRVCAVGTVVALIGATVVLIHARDNRTDLFEMRTCALEFVPHVPPTASIVVEGGAMFDEYGYPVAHNASMLFSWMDRKGFSYGVEELGLATLDRIAARGGRYWVVHRNELEHHHLQALADQHYRLVTACSPGYFLYDLQPSHR